MTTYYHGYNQLLPEESFHSFLFRNAIDRARSDKRLVFSELITEDGEWRAFPKLSDSSKTFFSENFTEDEITQIIIKSSPLTEIKPFVAPVQMWVLSKALLNPSWKKMLDDNTFLWLRKRTHEIKYCKACLADQIEKYGTAYFKRQWYWRNECEIHQTSLSSLRMDKHCGCEVNHVYKIISLLRGYCKTCKQEVCKRNMTSFTSDEYELEKQFIQLNFLTPCAMTLAIKYLDEKILPKIGETPATNSVDAGYLFLKDEDEKYEKRKIGMGWKTYKKLFLHLMEHEGDDFWDYMESNTEYVKYFITDSIAVDMSYGLESDKRLNLKKMVSCFHCTFGDYGCQLSSQVSDQVAIRDKNAIIDKLRLLY